MRAKLGPAGRCTNRTPSQPRQPDAAFGRICVFLFRRKVSLPLSANLGNVFPKGTPREVGTGHYGQSASRIKWASEIGAGTDALDAGIGA